MQTAHPDQQTAQPLSPHLALWSALGLQVRWKIHSLHWHVQAQPVWGEVVVRQMPVPADTGAPDHAPAQQAAHANVSSS
jgi:hypothetical protein